jgi:hypothetical protein
VKPQIHPAAALTTMNRPSVTITRDSGLPPSTGLISTRSTSIPPTKDTAKAPGSASHSGTPPCASPQATNVENIAISPWAKLTTPVDRKISTSASASVA